MDKYKHNTVRSTKKEDVLIEKVVKALSKREKTKISISQMFLTAMKGLADQLEIR